MTVGDAQDAPLVVAAPVLDRYLAGVASFLVALSAAVVALLGPMGAGTIVYRTGLRLLQHFQGSAETRPR